MTKNNDLRQKASEMEKQIAILTDHKEKIEQEIQKLKSESKSKISKAKKEVVQLKQVLDENQKQLN